VNLVYLDIVDMMLALGITSVAASRARFDLRVQKPTLRMASATGVEPGHK
jgi:hypothetical protein